MAGARSTSRVRKKEEDDNRMDYEVSQQEQYNQSQQKKSQQKRKTDGEKDEKKADHTSNVNSEVPLEQLNQSNLNLNSNSNINALNATQQQSAPLQGNTLPQNNAKHNSSNVDNSNKDSQTKINFSYTHCAGSTYGVWIRKIVRDNLELSPYSIGEIIFDKFTSVIEIKRKDKYRCEVIFNKSTEANILLNSFDLNKFNLEAFVPDFKRKRKGIVFGVPANISVEKIVQSCNTRTDIVDITRMMRRNLNANDETNKLIATNSILITFSGQTLPSEIVLLNCLSKVRPYVQNPMQCFNCYRFGHTAKTCKGNKICINCGEIDHEDAETCKNASPRCINCNGQHRSNDRSCEMYLKYKEINTLMAYRNLSFLEAKNIVIPPKPRAPLNTIENFPSLRARNNIGFYSQILDKYSIQTQEVLDRRASKGNHNNKARGSNISNIENSQGLQSKQSQSRLNTNQRTNISYEEDFLGFDNTQDNQPITQKFMDAL
ncbi:hypothetical protein TSAR_005381, partial [Trichomalopsis sarcophagae]